MAVPAAMWVTKIKKVLVKQTTVKLFCVCASGNVAMWVTKI